MSPEAQHPALHHPLWMALQTFGLDAILDVVGRIEAPERSLSESDIEAIARRSPRAFWTDGRTLFGKEPPADAVPSTRKLSASDALAAFGLARLYEARERGGTPLS